MSTTLNWGIIGAGRIAGIFARALQRSKTGRLAAVGSRNAAKAAAFAKEFPDARAHGGYEALIADPAVQAVYIATPHPDHAAWVIRAAEAGKHVLCEKPLALNHPEAMVAAEACRAKGVLLMEGFMYRFHPQTRKIVEVVRSGELGTIGLVQASFGFAAAYAPGHRKWADHFGGGSILDVGCYPVSFARLIAGLAEAASLPQTSRPAAGADHAWPFANPVEVSGAAQLHPAEGTDTFAAATLKFAGGLVAQVACGIGLQQDNSARIYGTAGWLHVPAPWILHREGGPSKLYLHKAGAAEPEEIAIENEADVYALEADAFAAAVDRGAREVPEQPVADSLGNMAALDAWRAAIGLVYESEKPAKNVQPVARRPLARRPDAPMKYAPVAGIDLPVSRLILGADHQRTMPQASAQFDDYFERGGNTIDTAHIYGNGLVENFLGHWFRHRGVRSQTVLIGKGGHTPWNTPEYVTQQLEESLGRMQTDYVDIYFLHRDNPAVPVGEFIDVLNGHMQAGRMKIFGASNWTIGRVAAANRYAKRKGLQGFTALSNQLSLARMVEAQWPGCLTAGDPISRKWLKKTQTPLIAWSSQARGYFSDRPGRSADPELIRCWGAEDNTRRRERAATLAAKKGVSTSTLALAYVLHQAFPTFAVIGPRTIAQLMDSLAALPVELTPHEVAWLNLERARAT
ncbi:MAG TPA: aldo/keto reductase [Opitutaceae bacterium]|nr:aldo/keto reductase [Opitutaceae bacterium]